MNELFDKLTIRIIFTIFVCITIFLYKYLHAILYPTSRQQLFKRFFPSKNSAHTIHMFSRLVGMGIIFSNFYFNLSHGIFISLLEFLIKSISCIIIYLFSIYILESITLYNFEYIDEILKRKSLAYALVSFAQAIGLAYVIKIILIVSHDSLIFLFLIWLFVMVIIGVGNKAYALISKMPFNRLLIQKNMAIAFSYTGFFWGLIILITSSLEHELKDIKWYIIQVILKLLLAVIIFPIFRKGLVLIFRIENQSPIDDEIHGPEIGYGIYEGTVLLTSCFLTSIITGHINFGTFYPVF